MLRIISDPNIRKKTEEKSARPVFERLNDQIEKFKNRESVIKSKQEEQANEICTPIPTVQK